MKRSAIVLALLSAAASTNAGAQNWIRLFNSADLNDWIPKIAKHPVGENYANTFRVENGILKVGYKEYDTAFENQFGHLFYKTPYSSYHLVVEYRLVGEWAPGTPSWAYRNSGVMLHAQDPKTMPANQDFPISVEFQFLAGLDDGQPRTTGNMCSPGTEVFIGAAMARSHCVNSTSKTYKNGQWVRAEAIVRGDSAMTFIIEGDTVLRLTKPQIGGGTVNGFDPAVKKDGTPLTSGYIALQSEGHPIEFRKVELRVLSR